MPRINLTPLSKPRKRLPSNNEDARERKRWKNKFYCSEAWKKLRISKLMMSPLCERCLEQGLTVEAVDVHHIESFAKHPENWRAYAFDYSNLMSLCKTCHGTIHYLEQQEGD